MKDEQFEHLMRDAATTFHRPPEAPIDEMWTAVEAGLGARDSGLEVQERQRRSRVPSTKHRVPWVAIAATLVIGVVLGRESARIGTKTVAAPAAKVAAHDSTPALSEPYQLATSRYLGQTAALLISLPNE